MAEFGVMCLFILAGVAACLWAFGQVLRYFR